MLIGNGEIANKDSGKGTVMIDSVYLPIRCEFGPSECYSKQFSALGWGVGIHGAVREAVPHSILFAIGRVASTPGKVGQRNNRNYSKRRKSFLKKGNIILVMNLTKRSIRVR